VVAYNAGQGALHFERPPGLFSFMNVERNLVLPLVVRPGIERVADLRGRTLAVDAVGTGFSFVLREILRVHGLAPEDYSLAPVGNARARLAALERGDYAGAVLNAPFDAAAVAAGLKVVASSRDAFADYQGTTFITTRAWAAAHESELVGFIKAMLRAMRWVRDPANAEAAADLLLRHMKGLDAARAARAVAALARNLTPDFNRAGIETVLALRRRYGTPPADLGTAADHVETRYLAAARAALGAEEG
ncbi:MAG: ABC transporter substrate-binding protein, partial [Rhodothalassiaceae bacterium]